MSRYPFKIITRCISLKKEKTNVPLKFTSLLSAGVNAKQEKLQWSQGVCVNDFGRLNSPLCVDGVRSHTWSKLHRRHPLEVGERWVKHGRLFLFICRWGPNWVEARLCLLLSPGAQGSRLSTQTQACITCIFELTWTHSIYILNFLPGTS